MAEETTPPETTPDGPPPMGPEGADAAGQAAGAAFEEALDGGSTPEAAFDAAMSVAQGAAADMGVSPDDFQAGSDAANLKCRARRDGAPISLIMLDLDHFKSINDRHGHIAGDAALRIFVDAVQQELRDTDLFGRLGGEEFCVVLLETNREDALRVAERMCERVATADLAVVTGAQMTITVSIGATAHHSTDSTIERLIERTDKALYEAKSSGRNRVVWRDG